MADEVDQMFEFARDLARKCGEMVKTAFDLPKNIETKSSPSDFVTETDQNVEKTIIQAIQTRFPDHEIIGEETSAAGKEIILTDKPTWVIDPVDGTTNFVSGFPYVAVCIGVMIKKNPVVGVVYNPILDQMFTAVKGKGATMNGKEIKVNQCKDMKDALILTEFGSSRSKDRIKVVTDNMCDVVLTPVRGIRALGSAACNICAVASGFADLYYETGMHIWDICAAGLILREAGGFTCSTDGAELDYLHRKFIGGCSSELALQVAAKLKQIDLPPDGTTQ